MNVETVNDYVDEMLWFSKIMAKDKGLNISPLRPPSLGDVAGWEAVYWTMKEVKQFIEEKNYDKPNNESQRVTVATQSRI